jgi:hypothetical protein
VGLRLWREKRVVGSLFGENVAPARLDPGVVDKPDTLDFLLGWGLELKGSRRFVVPIVDILFVGAAVFAAGGGGGFIPTDIGRCFTCPARAARVCLGAGLGGAAVFGGVGCEMIRKMPAARRNRPCSGGQLKYRSPFTEPSFLPEGSSSSTPIN